MGDNGWLRMIEENPGHSAWYIERFRSMAAQGRDLDGEARLVDAMVPRSARVLDAGCGPGRSAVASQRSDITWSASTSTPN
jgi:2-polyprenyl-3-methyl-5-hydroxy-6-metoxy-1,4-benzoquinol methylase